MCDWCQIDTDPLYLTRYNIGCLSLWFVIGVYTLSIHPSTRVPFCSCKWRSWLNACTDSGCGTGAWAMSIRTPNTHLKLIAFCLTSQYLWSGTVLYNIISFNSTKRCHSTIWLNGSALCINGWHIWICRCGVYAANTRVHYTYYLEPDSILLKHSVPWHRHFSWNYNYYQF